MRDNSAAHFENPPFAERVARRTGAATHVSNVWNPHVAGCSMVPHQEKNSKKKLQRIPQKGCRIKGSDVCRDGILSNLGLRFPCWTSKLPWSAGATDWSWMSFTQVAIHLNAWAFGFRVINAASVANEGYVYCISLGCKRFATKCSMSYWTVNWGGAIKTNRNINPNDSISFVFTYINPLNCPNVGKCTIHWVSGYNFIFYLLIPDAFHVHFFGHGFPCLEPQPVLRRSRLMLLADSWVYQNASNTSKMDPKLGL